MRKALLIVCVCLMSGCSGVIVDAQYSALLDRTAALAAETAARADAGKLSPAEMTAALDAQAKTWALFQDARDGKDSTAAAATSVVPASQPASCPASSAPAPIGAQAPAPLSMLAEASKPSMAGGGQ